MTALSTPDLMISNVRLKAELRDAIERSRDLVWLGARRRQAAPALAPRIGGGADDHPPRVFREGPVARASARESDDGVVSTALVRRTLCVECLVVETGVASPRVQTILGTLAKTFALHRDAGLCEACRDSKEVFRLL
jgi:hypothetical protein